MRNLRVTLLGPLLLFMLGLAGPMEAQEGTIAGQVTDAASGVAISGVQISIVNGTIETGSLSDQTGGFRLSLSAGTYQVTAQHLGYTTQTFER